MCSSDLVGGHLGEPRTRRVVREHPPDRRAGWHSPGEDPYPSPTFRRSGAPMDRRHFLSLLAASTTLLLASRRARAGAGSMPHVVVIGAGIVGASCAWHLASRGCKVTVLEARGVAAQASGHSFAWLNAGDGLQPMSYHVLRALALGEHRQIGRAHV